MAGDGAPWHGSRVSRGLLLVTVLSASLGAPAAAAPLVAWGPLLRGDAEVVRVDGVAVEVLGWRSPTRARVAVDVPGEGGRAARVTAELDLAVGPRATRLVACASRPTPLVEGSPTSDGFALELLPAGAVEVRAGGSRALMVGAMPLDGSGLEELRRLPLGALAARCATAEVRAPGVACEPFTLRSRAQGGATVEVREARAVTHRPAGAAHAVTVEDAQGLRWRGFADRPPACAPAPSPGDARGVAGEVAPAPRCQRERLPRGAWLEGAEGARLLVARRAVEATVCVLADGRDEVRLAAGGGEVALVGALRRGGR
jgi:hypothetical protein